MQAPSRRSLVRRAVAPTILGREVFSPENPATKEINWINQTQISFSLSSSRMTKHQKCVLMKATEKVFTPYQGL